MTKEDFKEKRYSLQEMLIYCLLIFIFGNASGAAILSGRSDTRMEIKFEQVSRRLDSLESGIQQLRDEIRDLKLKKELGK